MGYFYVDITVRGVKQRAVRALVDTDASYLVLGPETVRELELSPTSYEVDLTLADRRKVRAKLYMAEVEADGRKGPVMVAELEVPTPLLGIFALETLGLRPNPLTGKLEVVGPEGGYLLPTDGLPKSQTS
ncbi:MAG: aspartyl protease family protein [Candidatus Caldarchaeum sp.]|nr:aspartyl protease family protein [Candidatus Caldarchaeum sp.]